MGILHTYAEEGATNNDFTKLREWSKTIRPSFTEAGQQIQALNKYTRTPEGAIMKAQQLIDNVDQRLQNSILN